MDQSGAKRVSPKEDLILLVVVFVWGFNYVAAKLGLKDLDALVFSAVRNVATLLALLIIVLIVDRGFRVERRHLWRLALIGLVGMATNQITFNVGVKYTSAANASLILACSPVFGLLFGILLDRERVRQRRWLGVFGALGGVALVIAGGQNHLQFGLESLYGDGLMIISSVAWALYAVLGRPILKFYSPLQVTFFATLFGVLFMTPITLGPALAQSWQMVPLFAILMAIHTGVSTAVTGVLWYRSIGKAGAPRALIFMYLVPLFAVVSAVIFLGETITMMQVAGAVVVLGGVYVARQA